MNKLLDRTYIVLLACVWLVAMMFTSCSEKDYVNAIPASSTALLRLDAQKLNPDATQHTLAQMLGVDDVKDCGIDFTEPLYAFETIDGNIGLCAKVGNADDVENFLNEMAKKGRCSHTAKVGDVWFSDVAGAWCAGFSKTSLVVLGPVTTAALPDARRKVARMLRQDAETSIVQSALFERMDTMDAAVALVAKAVALPEKLVAPVMLGAPEGAEPARLMVAASISQKDRHIVVDGTTFSTDKALDKALAESKRVYRKIGSKYLQRLLEGDAFAMVMNVSGEEFLPLLHRSKALQAVLVGLNTAIDFDAIMRSVNGGMIVKSGGFEADALSLSMLADMPDNAPWLKDVDYWRESVQKGCSIKDMADKSWMYVSGNTRLGFGIREGEFFASTSENDWHTTIQNGERKCEFTKKMTDELSDARLVIFVGTSGITSLSQSAGELGGIATAILGDAKGIVYVMR